MKIFTKILLCGLFAVFWCWGTEKSSNISDQLDRLERYKSTDRRNRVFDNRFPPQHTTQDDFNWLFLKNRPPHPLSSTREYAVFRMRVLQELKTNPELYWAFDFASQGQDGWDFYVRSTMNNTLKQDILRLMSDTQVKVGVGPVSVGMKHPLIEDMANILREEWIFGSEEPPMPLLSEMATLVTDVSFDACEDGGLYCKEFEEKFPFLDRGVFSTALNIAKTDAQSWPESKKWEVLKDQFPEESSFVRAIQTEKNTEKLMDIMADKTIVRSSGKEQRVAHISLSTDSDFQQNADLVIAKLKKSEKSLKGQLKEINEKTINKEVSNKDSELESSEMKELLQHKANLEQGIKANEKAQELREHHNRYTKVEAWIGAATSTARLLNAPPFVVKIGVGAGIGAKIFKASKSMLIAGAFDPTGITAIANGVGALSPEAQQKLRELGYPASPGDDPTGNP